MCPQRALAAFRDRYFSVRIYLLGSALFEDVTAMRLFNLFRLSPLAAGEPASPGQLAIAAAPWALAAVIAVALLVR